MPASSRSASWPSPTPGCARTWRRSRTTSPTWSARRTSASKRTEPFWPGLLAPDDADVAHALAGLAAQVVGEREPLAGDGLDLPFPGLAAQLQPALEQHPEAGRTDRVTERLEPAVGVHGELAVEVEGSGEHLLPRHAPLGEPEILHEHELGGREAVVHLGHRELFARVGDAR